MDDLEIKEILKNYQSRKLEQSNKDKDYHSEFWIGYALVRVYLNGLLPADRFEIRAFSQGMKIFFMATYPKDISGLLKITEDIRIINSFMLEENKHIHTNLANDMTSFFINMSLLIGEAEYHNSGLAQND